MSEMLIGSVFCLFGSFVMAFFLWAVLEIAGNGKNSQSD